MPLEGCGREDGALDGRRLHEHSAEEEADSEGNQKLGSQADDRLQGGEDLGLDVLDVFGLGIDLCGVTVATDLGHTSHKAAALDEVLGMIPQGLVLRSRGPWPPEWTLP